jgi:hypothetical protein
MVPLAVRLPAPRCQSSVPAAHTSIQATSASNTSLTTSIPAASTSISDDSLPVTSGDNGNGASADGGSVVDVIHWIDSKGRYVGSCEVDNS